MLTPHRILGIRDLGGSCVQAGKLGLGFAASGLMWCWGHKTLQEGGTMVCEGVIRGVLLVCFAASGCTPAQSEIAVQNQCHIVSIYIRQGREINSKTTRDLLLPVC